MFLPQTISDLRWGCGLSQIVLVNQAVFDLLVDQPYGDRNVFDQLFQVGLGQCNQLASMVPPVSMNNVVPNCNCPMQ